MLAYSSARTTERDPSCYGLYAKRKECWGERIWKLFLFGLFILFSLGNLAGPLFILWASSEFILGKEGRILSKVGIVLSIFMFFLI